MNLYAYCNNNPINFSDESGCCLAKSMFFGAVKGAISGAVNSKYCFIAGTLVLTDQGLKAIDTLKVGDKVYAEDTETGMKAYKEIVQVFENETNELYHITVDEEIITTTKGHPFYVKDKGWTNASELKTDDELLINEGLYGKIVYIEVEQIQEKVKTYNLEVEGYHTYYVGEKEVLVHNDCANNQERHHVVEQCQAKRSNLNIADIEESAQFIDKGVHRNISRLYSSKGTLDGVNHFSELGIDTGGKVLRNWLNHKPLDKHLEIGNKVLNHFIELAKKKL